MYSQQTFLSEVLKTSFALAMLAMCFAAFIFPVAGYAQATGMSEYTLGSGDRLRIHVFGEEDLTIESQLSDAGTLSYPFLGEIKVSGLTAGQLQERITRGLKGDYLVNPKVTVSITQYRQFYINGEVKQPGGFSFQPGLTVRKAVSLAGGFTERASKSNIFIISDGQFSDGGKKVSLSEMVKPGDIITVDQSFF